MNREQILAILYEMAIVIGGETSLQPLVAKTLQRLLFHTSFPCGMVLLFPEGVQHHDHRCEYADIRMEASIGDYELSLCNGSPIRIPTTLLQGEAELTESAEPLNMLPCRKDYYRVFLKLPIGDCGVILLLSPHLPTGSLPLARIFQPVLGNFAKAILLCRSNEAYTQGIIKDRQTAETAFQDLNYRNSLILDSVGEGICGLDRDGNATFVNPAAAKMLGFTPEELKGSPLHNMLHHRSSDGCGLLPEQCPITLTLREGSYHNIADGIFRKKDGSDLPVEYVSTPLRENDAIVGAVIVFQDITERRQLEKEKEALQAQLVQSQKMEAIGQLAGGVAHDFNNILTVIMGFGDILKMKLKSDDPLHANVVHILEAANRAAHLTRSLLAFSRKQAMNPKPENLNEIVRGVEKFLRRVIGEDIQLETNFKEEGLLIHADRGQMEQVLMNLATNARDAIGSGGRLIIQTESVELDSHFIKSHGYGRIGTFVLISVTDTGAGMDKETCTKIFEPFFTTKETGRGTGLGLAIVYGIVKQHNGYINVYSEPGHGTTFRIFLPLLTSGEVAEPKAPPPYPEGGTETILLAEDEPTIRGLLASTLRDFGYTVIEAEDGSDALAKFTEHCRDIQLLVFDVIMPKKSGVETYEEIRKLCPEIKILFLTGYTADFIRSKGLVDENQALLMKPIFPVDLVRKIEEMLK
ncbi:MAG: ATP-binding protein [Pelobacteraceae bacterium]